MLRGPDNLIFKSNFGTGCYAMGEVDKPLSVLNEISDEEVHRLKESHPYGFVTYARLLAKAKLSASPLYNDIRFRAIANDALNLEGFKGAPESAHIVEVLSQLNG